MANTIVTFTSRSLEEILASGGSQEWVLSRKNARAATYLVCARNAHGEVGTGPGPETHKSGFLIGKISGLGPGETHPDRFIILLSEYALIDAPDLWKFGRNPVHYVDFEELGIDPEALEWQPMPEVERPTSPARKSPSRPAGPIQAAKQQLAALLGIGPESIEITIRA